MIAILVAAAALIVISGFVSKPDTYNASNEAQETADAAEFERYTQERLCEILKKIDGVGRCYVMVTVKDNGETYYNREQSRDSETEKRQDGTLKESVKTEEKYVMIENKSDGQSALSAYRLQPKICGVVVVCDGGETPAVRERVINAVKAATGIGSDRIFVTKT